MSYLFNNIVSLIPITRIHPYIVWPWVHIVNDCVTVVFIIYRIFNVALLNLYADNFHKSKKNQKYLFIDFNLVKLFRISVYLQFDHVFISSSYLIIFSYIKFMMKPVDAECPWLGSTLVNQLQTIICTNVRSCILRFIWYGVQVFLINSAGRIREIHLVAIVVDANT